MAETHACATTCPGPKYLNLRPSTAYHVALLSLTSFFTFIALVVNELAKYSEHDSYKFKIQWNKNCGKYESGDWECHDNLDDEHKTYGIVWLAMTLLSFFWGLYMISHVINMDRKWDGFKTQASKRAARNFRLAILHFLLVTLSWLVYVIRAPVLTDDDSVYSRGASINLMITVWVACIVYLCTSYWTTHVKLWGLEEEVEEPQTELEVRPAHEVGYLGNLNSKPSSNAMTNNKYAPDKSAPPSYNAAPPSYNATPPSYNAAPPSYGGSFAPDNEGYVPSTAPTAPSGGKDLGAQIRDLKDLHSQGILDDEEFAQAKAKLLD